MDKQKVAIELLKVAKGLAADSGGLAMYQERLEIALKALEHVPVEYAWDDPKTQKEMRKRRMAIVEALNEMIHLLPVPVTYKVVGIDLRGQWDVRDFKTEAQLIAAVTRMGFKHIGYQKRRNLKPQLIDQPIFSGLIGPMYDGPKVVRYETHEVHDQLSV